MLGLAIKKLWLALAANTCPGYMNGLRKHYWHIEGVPNRCLIARMLTSPCSLMGGHWEVTSLIKETILASLPGMGEEEEKKRLVHTFIATEFCGDCVHQCMYVCTLLMPLTRCIDVPVSVLFEWVLYHTVLRLLITGYLEIKLSRKNRLPPMSTFTKKTRIPPIL